MTHRPIFRESAVESYRRGAAKDIVPRLTFRPVVVCLWLLLAVLTATAALAWSVRVPAYVSAQGTVLADGARAGPGGGTTTTAVLFLPADRSAHVRAGRHVQAQVGSSGPAVAGTVVRVEPDVTGPDTARTRYGFEPGPDTVRQPWTVVIVRLGQPLPAATYGGSLLTARVEAGSQRILTLFPAPGAPPGGAA
ncbi:hypothetical protein [Streptomyces sp. NPDC057052]|uniref:hypothetical protein n=1 Tax=Streptomyces sp. NPDC057052 TaxID=3346010 RepID=UPI003636228B